jgi:predicted transcriptional regulator
MNILSDLLLAAPTNERLGSLEQLVLSSLWRRGDASVQEVVKDVPMAYTTIATTLNRLCKKQIATCVFERRVGKRVVGRYSPRYSQAELERKVAVDTIRRVLGFGTTTPILPLSYMVDAVGEHDPELLSELRRMVDEKKRVFLPDSK